MAQNVTVISPGFAGNNNTFIPSAETTYNLIQGFSKNVSKFAINRVAQSIPVNRSAFYYMQWNSVEAGRLTGSSNPGLRYKWQDGQNAPSGVDETESFNNTLAETNRWNFPFLLGAKAVNQASFDISAAHYGMVAQKAMTMRTLDAYNVFLNSGVTSTSATSLGGGKFDVGTPTNPYMRIGTGVAATNINLSTLGVVVPTDLVLVMNPHTAELISAATEITDNLKFTAGYLALSGTNPKVLPGSGFGLDGVYLFGMEVIVDTTCYTVTDKVTSPAAFNYVVPAEDIFMISRQGGLEGIEGSANFSTINLYFYEEFTAESMYDANNRVYKARVVTDYIPIVSIQGQKAGQLITAATAS